jgi:hypothetical protein
MALSHITATSEDILKYLKNRKFELTDEDKEFIRKTTYDAISSAYLYESNGCDCGQMWCPICGG